MANPQDPDFVQSLARGLAVIKVFDARNPSLNLTEIAKRAGIPPAAARRFLRTLTTLGYVRTEGRMFSLTPRILELGFSYLSALSLPEVTQPHLERLSEEVEESVSCAVLSHDEIVYIARVSPRRIMTVGITIGTRFPAYVTSMGRVLLAALPNDEVLTVLNASRESADLPRFTSNTTVETAKLLAEIEAAREQGWALVNGELEAGLCSLAVPVHGRDGSVAAAVNISTTTSRHSPDKVIEEFLPLLKRSAAQIEADLRLM